jgi:hypothetical protein
MRTRALLAGTSILVIGTGALAANTPPASIHIAGDAVFPESLTSLPDGTVFIGGAGSRIIYRAGPGESEARPWALPWSDNAGFLGVFADAKNHTLWACTRPGPVSGSKTPAVSTLRSFDLASGVQQASYTFPTDGGTCNDIAIARDGTLYATDTPNMQIVRLKRGAKSIDVWAGADGAFGAKGDVLDGIAVVGNRVLVNALATSKLFSVPIGGQGKPGKIAEVKLDKPIDRPDGMRAFGTKALLVAESGSGGHLSKVSLDGNTGKREVLKDGWPDGPVAVTVVGQTAYLLEGQLSLLRNTDPKVKPQPFKATGVPVGKP